MTRLEEKLEIRLRRSCLSPRSWDTAPTCRRPLRDVGSQWDALWRGWNSSVVWYILCKERSLVTRPRVPGHLAERFTQSSSTAPGSSSRKNIIPFPCLVSVHSKTSIPNAQRPHRAPSSLGTEQQIPVCHALSPISTPGSEEEAQHPAKAPPLRGVSADLPPHSLPPALPR